MSGIYSTCALSAVAYHEAPVVDSGSKGDRCRDQLNVRVLLLARHGKGHVLKSMMTGLSPPICRVG